ncbi:MAG: hypothetical protein ACQESF_03700 [Nanobdellota archaeon]
MAANTHVNVTMEEIVFQNVTFAEDFDLTNQQKSCMVEGSINTTNPSEETVFDIYLLFRNVDKLTTDFFLSGGRNASVIQGGAGLTDNVSQDIENTINHYTMPIDLDNDGNTDYAWVNSTDFIFNLSSESSLIGVPLGVDISSGLPKTISVTEAPITGSENFGNITIQGDAIEANTLNVSSVSIDINERLVTPIIIHIPELRENDSSQFIYNMSCMGKEPPVTILTNYSNDFHTDINKKVLAGHNWTLNQTVSNKNIGGKDITNLNITMNTQYVPWNNSRFYFNFSGLYPLDDYTNVHQLNNHIWSWAPAGGTLAWGSNESIKFNMTAPFSVPFSATYMALLENVTYSVDYLLTNLSLESINASADLVPDFEKRIYKPADNKDNHNVTWEIKPYVSTDKNITYDLQKVTLWVTHNMNPQNYTGLNKTYNNSGGLLERINRTDPWNTETDPEDDWYFNYTDGSNATNPPPIVWIEPEWLITNKYGQIKNFSKTLNGEDLYMKYIYVVNGYWLQINKNVTSIGEGQYRINTTVQNIGNGWTPEYEEVTIYDFVPKEFTAWNFTVEPPKNETVGTSGSNYQGQAFVWDVPWKDGKNSSLGPMRGPNATGYNNYTWSVAYTVNGSGQYKVTELYVVGLDPQKVDGAFASPIITVISSIQSHTHEVIYIGIIAFLIVLNVTNLVITNRINRKISKNMPAPPPKPKN